jgi:P-type E1-E2 ATPase
VAKCIGDFKEADIKVWMLTGDKGETAHQIAFSCGLYPQNDGSFKTFKFEEVHYGKIVTEKSIM